jgi:hypothetical protein
LLLQAAKVAVSASNAIYLPCCRLMFFMKNPLT